MTPTITPTASPTPSPTVLHQSSPTAQPQARLIVALEEQPEPMLAGKTHELTLVVRNDGSLNSQPMELLDEVPAEWAILGAGVTQGLVSIAPGQVRVRIGSVSPARQIIVTITLKAPALALADSQHCVALYSAGQRQFALCAALPRVLAAQNGSGRVVVSLRAPAPPLGPAPAMTLLADTSAGQQPGQGGATLLARNNGTEAAHNIELYLELGDDWRLSDVLTTLGLVSLVDHTARVRLGRLDAGALVAVTLRGWVGHGSQGGFCVTLMMGEELRQRECGRLLEAPGTARR